MSTTGVHVRNRHTQGIGAAGVFSRDTHVSGGFDPTPSDEYYGGIIDYEMPGLPDIPVDVLPIEEFDPATLPPGWLPPTAFDPTPPAMPTALTLGSGVVTDADGHAILRLIISLQQPTDADLYGSWVEFTNRYTYDAGGQITGPVWDRPSRVFLPKVVEQVHANPGFEVDDAGWEPAHLVTRDTAVKRSGTASGRWVSDSSTAFYMVSSIPLIGATAGREVRGQAWVYVEPGSVAVGRTLNLYLSEAGGAFAEQYPGYSQVVLVAGWQLIEETAVLTRNDRTLLNLTLARDVPPYSVGETIWIDDVFLSDVVPGYARVTVEGPAGATLYYARAYAEDVQSNRSAYTPVLSYLTTKDASAPPIPQGLSLVAGYRGFGASWDASGASDLMFNEIRYAPDIGTGLAPDTASWVTVRARTNSIFIGSLVGEARYWCQVRAVDLSGNVETDNNNPAAVDYRSNPEAGWAPVLSVVTTLIGSEDIGFGAITAGHISVGALSADVIGAGTLIIRPLDGFADGIEVQDAAGVVIGRWDEFGIKITDPTNPLRYVLLAGGELKFTNDGGLNFPAAITPEGIDASRINFGALSGGHNLVLNSSFELAAFAAAPATNPFTDATKWAVANRVTVPDNVTEGNSLVILAAGFA